MMGAAYTADRYFYPRPPRGGRPPLCCCWTATMIFLSTPSARRATKGNGHGLLPKRFLSTPSARRATEMMARFNDTFRFLSTPSARRATWRAAISGQPLPISIHALREEGDVHPDPQDHLQQISIHALREEGDVWALHTADMMASFLSTPSARRATPSAT